LKAIADSIKLMRMPKWEGRSELFKSVAIRLLIKVVNKLLSEYPEYLEDQKLQKALKVIATSKAKAAPAKRRSVMLATAARLRLQAIVDSSGHHGTCTGCSRVAVVQSAETNWGLIELCQSCLSKATRGRDGVQPVPKREGKWNSNDILDHRVPGSFGSGKRR
jgi:hypothetical protein